MGVNMSSEGKINLEWKRNSESIPSRRKVIQLTKQPEKERKSQKKIEKEKDENIDLNPWSVSFEPEYY